MSLDLLKTRRRERTLLGACLTTGQPLVVDNTNVSAAGRERYITPAKVAGFRVVGYFFVHDLKGSRERNDRREGRRRMLPAGLYGTLKRLGPPRAAEGFDELFKVSLSPAGEFAALPWDGAGKA